MKLRFTLRKWSVGVHWDRDYQEKATKITWEYYLDFDIFSWVVGVFYCHWPNICTLQFYLGPLSLILWRKKT